ncbi:MAG: 50S ribosomal protein L18 [Deltaproteobacteria bacterium]|nr:50S ribosomal protein L18 [Candidatus Anaeroferrophillacea bacterium]
MDAKRRLVRARKKRKIRSTVSGTPERPRLTVFRSARHIYVQAIDDLSGRTLASAATTDGALPEQNGGNVKAAEAVGKLLAARLLEKGVSRAVFDRNGFLYHGRIRAVAEGAREAGITI